MHNSWERPGLWVRIYVRKEKIVDFKNNSKDMHIDNF